MWRLSNKGRMKALDARCSAHIMAQMGSGAGTGADSSESQPGAGRRGKAAWKRAPAVLVRTYHVLLPPPQASQLAASVTSGSPWPRAVPEPGWAPRCRWSGKQTQDKEGRGCCQLLPGDTEACKLGEDVCYHFIMTKATSHGIYKVHFHHQRTTDTSLA